MGERTFKKKPATMELTKENGWFLTPEGLELCNNSFEEAINMDLSEIGAPSLPEDLGKGKVDVVKAGIILQISKLRNVSAPKSNEDSKAAPRMLKITLTDGKKSCNAIEMSKLDGISLEKTMPGVKVKLSKDVSVSSGYLLLETGSLTVIGGHVEALAKKWQMKTEVWTREQDGVEGLPPAWVPFGSKIPGADVVERNFKALPNQSSTANKENSEFDSLRNDAIKEASKTGNQKVFGAGSKDIKEAERPTRVRDRQKTENGNSKAEAVTGGERGKGGRKGKGRNREDDVGLNQTKPSGNVSLFAFLEEKLPVELDNGKKPSLAVAHNDWNPTPKRTARASSEKQDRNDLPYNEKQRRGDQATDNASHRGRGRGGRTGNSDSRFNQKTEENGNPRDYSSSDFDQGSQFRRGNSTYDSRGGRGGDRGRGSRSGRGGGHSERSRDDFSNYSDGLRSNGTKHSDENFRHSQRGGRGARSEREQTDRGPVQSESSHERQDQSKFSDRGRHGRSERGSYASRGNNVDKGGLSNKDSKASNSDRGKFGNRAQYPDLCSNTDKQSEVSQLKDKSDGDKNVSSGNIEKNGSIEKSKPSSAEGGRRKERQGPESRSSGQSRPMNDRDFGEWNNSTYHNSQQIRTPQSYQQQSQFQQNNHYLLGIQQHLQAALQSLAISDKGVSNQQKGLDGGRGQMDSGSQQTPDFSQPPPFKNEPNNTAGQWSTNQMNVAAHSHYVRGGARGGGNSQGRSQWKQQMQVQTGQGLQGSNQQPNFLLSSHILIQQQQPPQTHSAHSPANIPHQTPNYPVHKQPQAHSQPPHQWKNGDQGMAKYWEDGKYYPIEVSAISTTTAVVLYKDYGNFEEVLLQDLLPMPTAQSHQVGQPMRFIPVTPGLPPAFPHS